MATANRKSGTFKFMDQQSALMALKKAYHAKEISFDKYTKEKKRLKREMGIYEMEAARSAKRNR